MKKEIVVALFIMSFASFSNAQKSSLTNTLTGKSRSIDSFMTKIYDQGQFSGAIIVAEHGHIIYKKGFGFANRQTNEPFTNSTPCYIGSLSKQFTAMGIMILKERGSLGYDQPIRTFFPELPACMQPVTIRHLLHHTSGLATFDDYPDMNEKDVFNILLKQTSLHFTPGEKFEYCNAGYSLLGMLIEKLSRKTLNDFLTGSVFVPAGMKSTYVNEESLRSRKRATGYYLFGDEYNYDTFIGGAASVISTADDLYLWDKSLYNPKIVTGKTLKEAFEMNTTISKDDIYGVKSYGFGWFVCEKGKEKIVQHDGGFAGFRSYIERQVTKGSSIIFISNVRHSIIGEIRQAVADILDNKSYTVPKISLANRVMKQSKDVGMDNAIQAYKNLVNSKDSSQYYFSENEFNSLGYYLLRNNKPEDAVKFFRLNTEKNPASSNAFDSLGEAYMKAGNNQLSIASYQRSLELNPGNDNAANMIKKLRAE